MADSDDPDFIEVDIQRSHLSYAHLLTTCCRELAVNPQMVERIRFSSHHMYDTHGEGGREGNFSIILIGIYSTGSNCMSNMTAVKFPTRVTLNHPPHRKLPNTRLRNDRDTQRLIDYTELELVMKGHSRPTPKGDNTLSSTSKNNYKSIHGFKNQTILY